MSYQPPAPVQEPSYHQPMSTYQAPEPMYAPSQPEPIYAPPEPVYAPPQPVYSPPQPEQIENTNPYGASKPSMYEPPVAPSSYQDNLTTFGYKKVMRSEHNLGGDGKERSSIKLHHPPGGGGSLNIFGGGFEGPSHTSMPSKYDPPMSKYQPPSYDAPSTEPAAGMYSGGYDNFKAPLHDYNHNYEAPKEAAPMYQPPAPSYQPPAPSYQPPASTYQPPAPSYQAPTYQPTAPSGFTQSTSYDTYHPIEPSHLAVTSTAPQTFGQRVDSGMNSGPTSDKSSIRVHAPPGGKSSIFF